MSDLLKALAAPFDPARISWRVGSTTKDKTKGMALAYIDSRDVQDRLDAVCGPAGWQCRYPHAGQKTVCEIGILLPTPGNTAAYEWIWKADGAGDTDVEQEKGALSDAFKRAAVKWGIGRYLYDLDSPWVKLEQKGNSYVIDPSEYARLRSILGKGAPEPKQDNAPGVAKARQWVSNHLREIHSAESPKHLMEMLVNARAMWVRIKSAYPGLWSGPDGTGLRGEALKCATIYEVRDEFDQFVASVELHAENKPQAAE